MMRWILIVVGSLVGLIVLAVVILFALGRRPGAGRIAGSIEIDRPADDVWVWITEPANLTQWVSWLVEIQQTTPGPRGVGSQSVWLMDDPNMKQRLSIPGTVTRWEPGKALGAHIEMKDGFEGDYVYTLTESGGKTRLDQVGTFRYLNPIAALCEPLIAPQAKKKLEGDLAKLKQLAEAAAP